MDLGRVILEHKLYNSKLKIEGCMNFEYQFYKGIKLKLIDRSYNGHAKRFTLNNTNQNVWIPNKHLLEDGTIKLNENIDYVFRTSQKQLELAGYTEPIIGIKRKTVMNNIE